MYRKGRALGRPSCDSRLLRKKSLGAYPPIITPLKNGDSIIPFFTITFFDGAKRRAWLVPPEFTGDVAKIRLETTDMNLGCDGAPQRADLQTNVVAFGTALPQATPLLMLVYNKCVGATWRLGCAESSTGRLLYSAIGSPDVCLASPPTDTWIIPNSLNALQQLLYSGVHLLCRTANSRVLRAVRTVSPDVFELTWVEPASSEGFDVDLVAVLDVVCLPCSRIIDPIDPPGCCTNAGTFGLGNCCG